MENDFIEPRKRNWTSLCILVSKPNGSYWMGTYREINKITKSNSFAILRMEVSLVNKMEQFYILLTCALEFVSARQVEMVHDLNTNIFCGLIKFQGQLTSCQFSARNSDKCYIGYSISNFIVLAKRDWPNNLVSVDECSQAITIALHYVKEKLDVADQDLLKGLIKFSERVTKKSQNQSLQPVSIHLELKQFWIHVLLSPQLWKKEKGGKFMSSQNL